MIEKYMFHMVMFPRFASSNSKWSINRQWIIMGNNPSQVQGRLISRDKMWNPPKTKKDSKEFWLPQAVSELTSKFFWQHPKKTMVGGSGYDFWRLPMLDVDLSPPKWKKTKQHRCRVFVFLPSGGEVFSKQKTRSPRDAVFFLKIFLGILLMMTPDRMKIWRFLFCVMFPYFWINKNMNNRFSYTQAPAIQNLRKIELCISPPPYRQLGIQLSTTFIEISWIFLDQQLHIIL